MSGAAPLDHVVINTLRGMDAAAGIFSGLGFTLTPLGRHSLGSINHLMVAPGAYLELVGVPAEGKQRQEVLDSPIGLSGLVFKTDDADWTFERLAEAGLSPSEPVAFWRPVEVGAETLDAKFRTVKVPGELFPAGRVYFCEHLTPDLVWREEWLDHPNSFCGFERIEVAGPAPQTDADCYAAAIGRPALDGGPLQVTTGDGFRIDIVRAETPRFTTLGLTFRGLDRIEQAASATSGVTWVRAADGLGLLEIPSLDLTIECRSVS